MFLRPSETPDDNEVFKDSGPVFEEGLKLFYDRIEDDRDKYGWMCDVKSIHVSTSQDFQVIVRANVVWNINGDAAEAIDMLWRDSDGMQGVSSHILGAVE